MRKLVVGRTSTGYCGRMPVVVLVFALLQAEEFLLLLYLATQFLARGHVGQVLGGEELVVAVQHGVMRHVGVGVSTEQQTYGGVVALRQHQFVVHADIHIHFCITRFSTHCVENVRMIVVKGYK